MLKQYLLYLDPKQIVERAFRRFVGIGPGRNTVHDTQCSEHYYRPIITFVQNSVYSTVRSEISLHGMYSLWRGRRTQTCCLRPANVGDTTYLLMVQRSR